MPAKPAKSKSGISRVPGKLAPNRDSSSSWLETQLTDIAKAGVGLPMAFNDLGSSLLGQDPEAVREMGRAQVEAVKSLGNKEAWKEHTAMQTLTALGLIAPAGRPLSAARAASTASRGNRTAAAKKAFKQPPTRSFAGVPKKRGQIPRRYTVPASKSVGLRAIRGLTLDPLYRFSAKRAEKGKRGGGYARTQEQRQRDKQTRFIKQSRGVDTEARESTRPVSMIESAWQTPNNLMRLALPLRPRYYAQNLPSTALMLLLQQPLGLARSVKHARQLRKENPEIYKQAQAIMGQSGSSSVGIGARGPLSKTTKKVTHWANIPESHMRVPALLKEARRENVPSDDPVALQRLFNEPESSKFQRVAARSNEAVGDYSRLSPREINFMASGLPVFYSMNKALGRYAARMPTEHPTLTALLANAGMEGYEGQEEAFGGSLPPWSPYLIPSGKDQTRNPQNLLPYSPGTDILRGATASVAEGAPQWNLLNLLGPSPEALYAAASNRSLQTGWKLKNADERSPLENAGRELVPTLPGTDLLTILGLIEPRESKAYPNPDQRDALENWLAGRAYFNRETDFEELREQGARASGKPAKKKRKRKRGF